MPGGQCSRLPDPPRSAQASDHSARTRRCDGARLFERGARVKKGLLVHVCAPGRGIRGTKEEHSEQTGRLVRPSLARERWREESQAPCHGIAPGDAWREWGWSYSDRPRC